MSVELIREQLEQIAEELDDMAMSVLREAVEEGASARPAEEKRLTKARRAVERAASILEEPER